jgi:hypothetical protein
MSVDVKIAPEARRFGKKVHGALATPVPSAKIPSGVGQRYFDASTKQGLDFNRRQGRDLHPMKPETLRSALPKLAKAFKAAKFNIKPERR